MPVSTEQKIHIPYPHSLAEQLVYAFPGIVFHWQKSPFFPTGKKSTTGAAPGSHGS
jgi:hypothetical protein